MKTIKIIVTLFCAIITSAITAQQRQEKLSQSVNVPKDVTIDLNTSHVNIEIETWNKGVIEVDAYVESDELSREELKEAAQNWDLELKAFENFASIKSSTEKGLWSNHGVLNGDYTDALIDLQLNLADLPALPNLPEMPNIPALPAMPEMPALPKLPEGVTSVSFDYEAYKEGGEAYLEEWSREYEEKYGAEYKEKMKAWAKKFAETDFNSYSERMEEWGEKFGKNFDEKWAKDMEEWGEEFGKRFEGKWADNMEEWGEVFGEKFGKQMEEWGEKFGENFGENMEKWGEQFGKEMEKWGEEFARDFENDFDEDERQKSLLERTQKQSKERREDLLERSQKRKERAAVRKEELFKRLKNRRNQRVKRTLKIKMPKDAELKINVRHGKLKFVSAIRDLKADLSYTTLLATNIDGRDTSINASYSDVNITNWDAGELNLKYVENAILRDVKQLSLNATSSNIDIDNLTGNAIIDGSFGDLAIYNIAASFSNLNIILENSDASIKLPKTDYDLLFKGDRSKFNNERTNKKAIRNYPENGSTNKTILVNAKYSNVLMQ